MSVVGFREGKLAAHAFPALISGWLGAWVRLLRPSLGLGPGLLESTQVFNVAMDAAIFLRPKTKKPHRGEAISLFPKHNSLVAGAGFEPAAFRL